VDSLGPPHDDAGSLRCTTLSHDGTVCQELRDSTRTITAKRRDAPPFHLTLSWAARSAGPDSFEVIEADLDADGRSEIVVPVFVAQSNGMGVSYWTVYVLEPGKFGWSVDSVDVEEYSTIGSWVKTPSDSRCNLLRTQWVNGFDPKRQEGLYFEASWLTYSIGRFVRRVDRPTLHRRYLFGFENERSKESIREAPLSWLKAPDAVVW